MLKNIHHRSIKKLILALVFAASISVLSGCLYPQENRAENQVPYQDQIQAVQSAVDQYQKDEKGLLPIKTKDGDTPIYQKYLIDFKKIVPKYMAEPPGNAFESGGVFQYVLVDVENDPTVKLFDMRMAGAIQDLTIRLEVYRQSNGYPPFKERIADHVFTLDYKKLGLKEPPTVISPYSQKPLGLIINNEAQIFVDYTPDLLTALQNNKHNYKYGEDIRNILVENSFFVPAYSLPYTIDQKSNKPIFLSK
jgi:hypothetical protein